MKFFGKTQEVAKILCFSDLMILPSQTGSPRMLERPIKILVDALIELGAKIDYKKNKDIHP